MQEGKEKQGAILEDLQEETAANKALRERAMEFQRKAPLCRHLTLIVAGQGEHNFRKTM